VRAWARTRDEEGGTHRVADGVVLAVLGALAVQLRQGAAGGGALSRKEERGMKTRRNDVPDPLHHLRVLLGR
jgi:hypothetical protein